MEIWNSLPLVVRRVVLGIGIFGLGAAVSFGYSYRPLHGALVIKVDSLETRLDERNREYVRVKDELESLQIDEKTRIDPETLSQVESELAKTKQALAAAEKKKKSVEAKRRDAISNADQWRKRYETLRDQQQSMPAAKAADPKPSSAPIDRPRSLNSLDPSTGSSSHPFDTPPARGDTGNSTSLESGDILRP